MPGESFLQNPIAIIIAAVVAIILIALIIFLFARNRRIRREENNRAQAQLDEMERENQFAAAVDHVRYSQNPAEVANDIAVVFREYQALDVLAVYAGREKEDRVANILAPSESPAETPMPDSIASSMVQDFLKPQVTPLSAITGDEPVERTDQTEQSPSLETSEVAAAPADESGQRDSTATNEIGPPATRRSPSVLVLPWRGPFDWNGIIVAQAKGQTSPEMLASFRDLLARMSDRLAVALEFQQEHAEVLALDERATRTIGFSRSLISCLEDAAPLASITREVTKLLKADSAALWRVESGASMVRMVAANGLRSAEFLPLPIGQGLAGSVAQSGEPLTLEDAPSDPRCIFPREARESGIVSYLGVPILADDHAIGVIEVHTTNHHKWSASDQRTLKSAALIISEILRNTDVRGKRLRVESAYLGLSEALQRLRTPGEVMDAVVEVLGHALAVSRAFVVQFDDEGKPASVEHEYHAATVKPAVGAAFTGGLVEEARATENGEPIVIPDSRQKSLMDAATVSELGVLSELALPIRIEGTTRGIIYLHQCDRLREWQRDEIEFADRVTRQLSLSLSNVRTLDYAVREANVARRAGGEANARIKELEERLAGFERTLSEAREAESHARAMLAKVSAAEAKARAEADVVRRSEAEARQEREQIREDVSRIEASAKQLLETNRVKSEFIVNAGHEIEASLQSVLGLAELLIQGSYGPLTPEQNETVRGIYTWARRIKSDVELMIEYGSMRSRRLEEGGADQG